jgi:hypothetical protein
MSDDQNEPSSSAQGGKGEPQKRQSIEPLDDPATFVRTYAKDLAQVSGKPVPATPVAKQKTLQEAVADDAAKVPEKAPEEKEDPWTKPPPPSGRTPDEILADLKAKGADVLKQDRPTVVSLDERADILERLFKKAGKPNQEAPEPPPPFIPQVRKDLPPAPPPPPPPPPPVRQRAPEPQPERIHTFTSDFQGRIDDKRANVFSVLAAEQDRGEAPREILPEKRTNPLPILAGVALIFLGGLGIFFAYQFATDAPPIPVVLDVPSLIFADGHMELLGEEPLLPKLAEAATEVIPEGTVVITYVTTSTSTETGILTTPEPGGTLVRLLGLGAPDVLLRNILPESTIGIVHAGEETRPFFILKVSSFERTFAGMLAWEPRMAEKLASIYPPYAPSTELFLEDEIPFEEATSTEEVASSTPEETLVGDDSVSLQGLDLGPDEFVDEIVRNYDVRILYDESGRVLMLYGYKDRSTLIITRDKEAFAEILNRLSSTRTN